eukprot:496100_1
MARVHAKYNYYCNTHITFLSFVIFLFILSLLFMSKHLKGYSTVNISTNKTHLFKPHAVTKLNFLHSNKAFKHCNNLLDVLKIQWHNNTNCSWDFIPSTCKAIHKYNVSQTRTLLQLLGNNSIILTFFGDSVTRRTGKTLDMYINKRGRMDPFRDFTYKEPYSYFMLHSYQFNVNFQTEWAPTDKYVIDILTNESYKRYWYWKNTSINIAVIGVGIWMYGLQNDNLPKNTSIQWLIEHLDDMVHNYILNIYHKIAMRNMKNVYIILRTQTGIGLQRTKRWYRQRGGIQRTREDFVKLTKLFNKYVIQYAKQYKIPVFDTYHWSSVENGYHINMDKYVRNVEIYDQLDHENCSFCGDARVIGKYRHQCVECDDWNCVHMRSNGRMILIQQILNAVNIIAHKEHLLLK